MSKKTTTATKNECNFLDRHRNNENFKDLCHFIDVEIVGNYLQTFSSSEKKISFDFFR